MSESIRSVTVAAVVALRDACDDLLAHSEMGDDDWTPRAYPAVGLSADEAFQRDSDALGEALARVVREASDLGETPSGGER